MRVRSSEEAAARAVAGIVLASGMSTRFGARNKLLVPVDGLPLVRRTVSAYLGAGLDPVLVVVGYEADRVREALDGLYVVAVPNPEYEQGQSRGLVRGVRALPAETAAGVIGVGDQPALRPATLRLLVARWRETSAPAVYPLYAGQRGSPTLFDRSLFPELLEVTGDHGGRFVLQRHRDEAVGVEVEDPGEGQDVDTLDDYRRLSR